MLEPGQQPLAVAAARQGVGELARDAPDHAGVEQEPGQRGLLLREDLLGEVVGGTALVPGQSADGRVHVLGALEGQRGETEPCRPALRPRQQHGQLRRCGGDLLGGEELQGLRGVEAEVVGAELRQPAAQPQPLQRQVRVAAGGDHRAEGAEVLPGRRGQGLLGGRARDAVQVVEHEHPRRREQPAGLHQEVDEAGIVGRRGAQTGQGAPGADVGRGLQGRQDAGPELLGVPVLGLHRQPGHGRAARCGPPRQEQRLARPRRGGDDHGAGGHPGVEHPLETRAAHRPGGHPGDRGARGGQRFRRRWTSPAPFARHAWRLLQEPGCRNCVRPARRITRRG